MNWIQEGQDWFCRPYHISWGVRGYSAWVYAWNESRRLGRDGTLEQAKALCEEHSRQVAA